MHRSNAWHWTKEVSWRDMHGQLTVSSCQLILSTLRSTTPYILERCKSLIPPTSKSVVQPIPNNLLNTVHKATTLWIIQNGGRSWSSNRFSGERILDQRRLVFSSSLKPSLSPPTSLHPSTAVAALTAATSLSSASRKTKPSLHSRVRKLGQGR